MQGLPCPIAYKVKENAPISQAFDMKSSKKGAF